MDKIFGHAHMIALRGDDGLLCHQWFASDYVGIVLFTDEKISRSWLKKLAGYGFSLPTITPRLISSIPEGLKPTINPSDEYADMRRIIIRAQWHPV